jgi:general secretion pathway protein A
MDGERHLQWMELSWPKGFFRSEEMDLISMDGRKRGRGCEPMGNEKNSTPSLSEAFIAKVFDSFRENPFSNPADPKFLFLSTNHREILASIVVGIRERKGLILIIGEMGVGKTTLIRHLLQTLGFHVQRVFLDLPGMTFEDLLKRIPPEFNLRMEKRSQEDRRDTLKDCLPGKFSPDENLAIYIDNAQEEDRKFFENLRGICSLRDRNGQWVQTLMFGRPSLQDRLNDPALLPLKGMVALRRAILPLTDKEVGQYIEHHLKLVGSSKDRIFSDEALALISRHSEGISRTVNQLCHETLRLGFRKSQRKIDASIVHQVLAHAATLRKDDLAESEEFGSDQSCVPFEGEGWVKGNEASSVRTPGPSETIIPGSGLPPPGGAPHPSEVIGPVRAPKFDSGEKRTFPPGSGVEFEGRREEFSDIQKEGPIPSHPRKIQSARRSMAERSPSRRAPEKREKDRSRFDFHFRTGDLVQGLRWRFPIREGSQMDP